MLVWLAIGCSTVCQEGFELQGDGNCYPVAQDPQDALGGGEDPDDQDDESDTVTRLVLTQIAGSGDGLSEPRDLEFNPYASDELWTVNADDAVVVLSPANGEPVAQRFSGPEARHWLAKPSALAFGAEGLFATSHEDLGNNRGDPSMGMGPTLWPTDLEAFDGGRPSHLDMVHDSALSMGIAWERDNEYWVHDGYNDCLTWYDFGEPHEPGGTDHADARVVRYQEGEFGYVAEVPSHLAFDTTYPNVLYFADSGTGRVLALNTTSGSDPQPIGGVPTPPPPHDQATAGRWRIDDADTWVVVEGEEIGLKQPSGLEVHEGLIWVTDRATSAVWAFTSEGEVSDVHVFEELPAGSLAGLAFDADGALWLVDGAADRVLRVDTETVPAD
jgi:hypothetical protein